MLAGGPAALAEGPPEPLSGPGGDGRALLFETIFIECSIKQEKQAAVVF